MNDDHNDVLMARFGFGTAHFATPIDWVLGGWLVTWAHIQLGRCQLQGCEISWLIGVHRAYILIAHSHYSLKSSENN
jgi:hypothetical protein